MWVAVKAAPAVPHRPIAIRRPQSHDRCVSTLQTEARRQKNYGSCLASLPFPSPILSLLLLRSAPRRNQRHTQLIEQAVGGEGGGHPSSSLSSRQAGTGKDFRSDSSQKKKGLAFLQIRVDPSCCRSSTAMENLRSENYQQGAAMEGVKYVPDMANTNRRALRDIKNIIGAPHQHMAVSKRGLQDKPAAVDPKNEAGFAGHRPITRKFAATLASQPPSAPLAPIGSERQKRNADSAFHAPADMECTKISDELPLPMLSEMDEMMSSALKEIEMEDIEEAAPDIDSCDASNPLAVVDYVDEIYSFYRRSEDLSCVSPNYMSTQTDINEKMRGILIDWLIEVHYKLELLDETLFLTVNIIDRFLARENVVRKKLQLVGVTAMLLACKYEEVGVPVVEDLILICDRAYTRADILEMERMIVNTLQFNMSVPTPYCFMRRFLKAAQSDKKLELLSFFMIELSLADYEMLKFRSSMLAAAAIYTAQCTMNGFKSWNKCCELHTKYSEEQLMDCSKMMVELHQRAGHGKLTGVHRKYSTFKYGCAAKTEPATFLLDASLEL